MKPFVIFCLILNFIGCSRGDFIAGYTANSSSESKVDDKNYATEDLSAHVDKQPDSLSGGDGITIGNGQTNEAEIDEEISQPEIIIGSYLTCSIAKKNVVSCLAKTPLSSSDLDQITFVDRSGNEIPKDSLSELTFTNNADSYEMTIIFPDNVDLHEIKESSRSVDESPTENEQGSGAGTETENQETGALDCSGLSGGTWIPIPGNAFYGTEDFCVMKYEAKCSAADGQACKDIADKSPMSIIENTPWSEVTQQEAKSACSSLGAGYHLTTNEEWMTMATNVAAIGTNWSGSMVGSGQLIRGHSDNNPPQACPASPDDQLNVVEGTCQNLASNSDEFIEQRTHLLSNGEVIWDLGSNVREWVDRNNTNDKPTPAVDAWLEYTQPIVGTSSMPLTDLIPQIAIDENWNSQQAIGIYFPSTPGVGGALYRGGFMSDDTYAGIFSAALDYDTTFTYIKIGFRCTYKAP